MNRDVVIALGWAAAIVLVSLAAVWARGKGLIDAETTLRVVALNGLAAAYYGNRAPKAFVPDPQVRQANRFGGWAFALGGLAYAGFWAFAPIPLATILGTGALVLAVLATALYCLRLWLRAKDRRDPA